MHERGEAVLGVSTWMARNQTVSGSLVPANSVPTVSEIWCLHALHWKTLRVRRRQCLRTRAELASDRLCALPCLFSVQPDSENIHVVILLVPYRRGAVPKHTERHVPLDEPGRLARIEAILAEQSGGSA